MRTVLPTLAAALLAVGAPAAEPVNLLLVTVDDMNADSVGAFGCRLPGTTPNIDRLAAGGLRFEMAHVQVGNCMPSRNVMWSGRFPHTNGVEGFYQVPDPGYPVLVDLARRAGYFTAIRGKVAHSTPFHPYGWDRVLDELPDGQPAHLKEARSYGVSTEQGIRAATEAGRPFCLMINISDPHKPFHAQGRQGQTIPDPHVPSRIFTPDEVPVPGFLPDDPIVRKELAHYYSSVRRADDCVGRVLATLEAAGQADRTLVLFLSDHGMPLPFAKTQLYHHSTRTPLIIRWPGTVRAGTVDRRHLISAIDLLPTLLDIMGIEHPAGLQGRSFLPLLRGEARTGWDMVFKEYNENSGGRRHPMRAVQTPEFLYLFNPWSNGRRVMATATTGTPTYRRLKELAGQDAVIAARLELFDHRVLEEFYCVAEDPDALENRIADPQHAGDVRRLRRALEAWMERTNDPLLAVFRQREDAAAREAWMAETQAESDARRGRTRTGSAR